MRDESAPTSPEARRKRLAALRAELSDDARELFESHYAKVRPGTRTFEVMKRVAVGVYTDGFIHAGNLAYMLLVALFPFFIVAATIARIFGHNQDAIEAVNGFLLTVPHNVADVLRPPIRDVLTARSSVTGLLWLGGLVGLWSTGSLIETIRDILRRAYGTRYTKSFWRYRLGSIGIIVASIFAAMFALSLQFVLVGAEEFLRRVLPFADRAISIVTTTKLVPMAILCAALYSLFVSLTPSKYRSSRFPKWPGALLTALVWYLTTLLLPLALSLLTSYDLTYGSLAGVVVVLIFFFFVGLGVVIGAELNAALADFPELGEEKAVRDAIGRDD